MDAVCYTVQDDDLGTEALDSLMDDLKAAKDRIRSLESDIAVLKERLVHKDLELEGVSIALSNQKLMTPGFLERHVGLCAGVAICECSGGAEFAPAALVGWRF